VLKEFREFINKGNVVDLAVAFVLGIAFKAVIDAIAGSGDKPGILTAIIAIIFGGNIGGLANMGPTVNDTLIPIGALVAAIINFVAVAFILFLVVKAYNRFKKGPEAGPDQVALLTEIRDELRARR
jgi:large conductance mechanosensitive channel